MLLGNVSIKQNEDSPIILEKPCNNKQQKSNKNENEEKSEWKMANVSDCFHVMNIETYYFSFFIVHSNLIAAFTFISVDSVSWRNGMSIACVCFH